MADSGPSPKTPPAIKPHPFQPDKSGKCAICGAPDDRGPIHDWNNFVIHEGF